MNVEFHPIPLAMITTVATHNHGYDNTYDYDYIFLRMNMAMITTVCAQLYGTYSVITVVCTRL